jgi:endonuclease/exonuclease/phosphatase family metal-dependent hydrolase
MKALYKKYMPDLIGAQEVTMTWKNYLIEAMSEYGIVGEPREAIIDPEHTAILYKKERFELLETKTFALSESGEFGSLGWGEEYPRICTYAILKAKQNGDKIAFFNSHLALRDEARCENLKLIFEHIGKFNLPTLFTGDFNTSETSVPYKLCMETIFDDTKYLAKDSDDGYTCHNYDDENYTGSLKDSPIDYCMCSKGDFEVESYEIIRQKSSDGNPISDHYPVMAKLTLK